MQKLERASLVDQATKGLIKFINVDTVAIGDKMPSEAVLCEEYGVSRTTRESLRFLRTLRNNVYFVLRQYGGKHFHVSGRYQTEQ
jgi:DNA-binding FadR family transcriptional regulator